MKKKQNIKNNIKYDTYTFLLCFNVMYVVYKNIKVLTTQRRKMSDMPKITKMLKQILCFNKERLEKWT